MKKKFSKTNRNFKKKKKDEPEIVVGNSPTRNFLKSQIEKRFLKEKKYYALS